MINTINTNERIFQVTTYDGIIYLCNLRDFNKEKPMKDIKGLKHYWNYRFETIGKNEVIEMIKV